MVVMQDCGISRLRMDYLIKEILEIKKKSLPITYNPPSNIYQHSQGWS